MNTSGDNSCIRSVYIIDPSGTIRVILTYPKEIGRNINEILRILKALQKCDDENVVTPANWNECMPVIEKSPITYEDLKERVLDLKNYNIFDWYLSFKKEMEE